MSAETVPMVMQFLVYSASSRSRMASRRSLVLFSKAALSAYNMEMYENDGCGCVSVAGLGAKTLHQRSGIRTTFRTTSEHAWLVQRRALYDTCAALAASLGPRHRAQRRVSCARRRQRRCSARLSGTVPPLGAAAVLSGGGRGGLGPAGLAPAGRPRWLLYLAHTVWQDDCGDWFSRDLRDAAVV